MVQNCLPVIEQCLVGTDKVDADFAISVFEQRCLGHLWLYLPGQGGVVLGANHLLVKPQPRQYFDGTPIVLRGNLSRFVRTFSIEAILSCMNEKMVEREEAIPRIANKCK